MIRVGIVGATGYTGAELIRLLSFHDTVEIVAITSNSRKGELLADVFPSIKGFDLHFVEHDSSDLYACDLIFLATPNAVAMEYVPVLLKKGCRVIDLSADFRIRSQEIWQDWYKKKHSCPELLRTSVYGLPELNRRKIIKAELVANPGCYPTAVILGLLPAIQNELIELDSIIASAVSGVSGAGRKAVQSEEFSSFRESFKAYGAFSHRHLPEIEQTLMDIKKTKNVDLTFVPHLVSMHRGIHTTIYTKTKYHENEIKNHYTNFYSNEKFVDVMPEGSYPETKKVLMTNMCNVALHFSSKEPQQLVIFSVIDNLVKGAAGQAIQNMNIMFGLDEQKGLISSNPGS